MDKNAVPTYPGRPAEQDLHPVKQDSLEREENRLNASRETIRQILMRSSTTSSQQPQAQRKVSDERIDSWSSLLASWVVPAAKDAAGRHPYTLLLGSALIGAYFAWSKPLRKVVGTVVVGTLVRNLVGVSVDASSRHGARLLRNYLKRKPQKKYPTYQKQEHDMDNDY